MIDDEHDDDTPNFCMVQQAEGWQMENLMDAILELWSVMAECFSGFDRLTAQNPEAENSIASHTS